MEIYIAPMTIEECSYWDASGCVKADLERLGNADAVWEEMKAANLKYYGQDDYKEYSDDVDLSDVSSAVLPVLPDYDSFAAYCDWLQS